MKNSIFYLCIMLTIQSNTYLMPCPCEFSPEDKRPFFEQYDQYDSATKDTTTQEKKEKS